MSSKSHIPPVSGVTWLGLLPYSTNRLKYRHGKSRGKNRAQEYQAPTSNFQGSSSFQAPTPARHAGNMLKVKQHALEAAQKARSGAWPETPERRAYLCAQENQLLSPTAVNDGFEFLGFFGRDCDGLLAALNPVLKLVFEFRMLFQQVLQQMKRPGVGGIDLGGRQETLRGSTEVSLA